MPLSGADRGSSSDAEPRPPRSALDAIREAAGVHSQVSLPPDDDSAAAVLDPGSVELGPERRVEQYQLLGEEGGCRIGTVIAARSRQPL